mgnify:FL=1
MVYYIHGNYSVKQSINDVKIKCAYKEVCVMCIFIFAGGKVYP